MTTTHTCMLAGHHTPDHPTWGIVLQMDGAHPPANPDTLLRIEWDAGPCGPFRDFSLELGFKGPITIIDTHGERRIYWLRQSLHGGGFYPRRLELCVQKPEQPTEVGFPWCVTPSHPWE